MTNAETALLRTVGLRKEYGSDESLVRAVDDVALEVTRGETLAIMGPSGCGKSTLLHLLAFETYWTSGRGAEVLDYNYALMDTTVYGRQEPWEDSPAGWPQPWKQDDAGAIRTNEIHSTTPAPRSSPRSRPIAQWSRLEAGRSDDLNDAAR